MAILCLYGKGSRFQISPPAPIKFFGAECAHQTFLSFTFYIIFTKTSKMFMNPLISEKANFHARKPKVFGNGFCETVKPYVRANHTAPEADSGRPHSAEKHTHEVRGIYTDS